jgi:putative SOS response-associated peptidase YedK
MDDFASAVSPKLAERFGIEPDDDWIPRNNIAPTQNIPVIRLTAALVCPKSLSCYHVR